MQLTHGEIAWLLLQLEELSTKLPRTRYSPYYDARSWDLDDLFRAFREETVSRRDTIWGGLQERAMTGIWPKLPREAAFWLRERLSAGLLYCRVVLQGAKASTPIAAIHPEDGATAIKWILLDFWDEELSEAWLRENARSYVSVSWAEDEETEFQLERYLHRLEIG